MSRIDDIRKRWIKAIQVEKNPELALDDMNYISSELTRITAERDRERVLKEAAIQKLYDAGIESPFDDD